MAPAPAIVWFRQDLRLADQPALAAALDDGPVLPVFVLDDAAPGRWAMGGASRWWLHHSLASLDTDLRARGSRLILLRGDAVTLIADLAAATSARSVHAIHHYEPWARRQESELARRLALTLHHGLTLAPPARMTTKTGGAFKVFTPFWQALQQMMPPLPPRPAPDRIPLAEGAPAGDTLGDWGLCPTAPDWATGFAPVWQPGEAGARRRLADFTSLAADYGRDRDLCAEEATSRLSAHLHFGELSPATAWHVVSDAAGSAGQAWLRQLGWRDFSLNLLLNAPDLADVNWRRAFDAFPWVRDDAALTRWQRGQTGYPIVDAGLRQLWRTGWMHNRVRMIAASFLIKDLMIDWRAGETWFWDTLVDADLANNAAGWQWTAGSGADASPYFRIFNPVSQGRRFDPAGAYVRQWVPELAGLPDDLIHAPWEAPPALLAAAGVRLGETYPAPMVDHARARDRALAAYKAMGERG